ncbi:MAG: N-acetyltransferase, partial [Sphingomonadales bacterium]
MTELRTERLLLRPAWPSDLEALHAVLSHPQGMRYWSTLPHATIAETREWIDNMIAIPPVEGEDFVIVLDGAVIGKAGLYRFPSIGYILHPDHWGRGYAREALAVLIERAFREHGLKRIDADVDPRNLASMGLLGRLGFVETHRAERTWLIGDEWCDSVYLSL